MLKCELLLTPIVGEEMHRATLCPGEQIYICKYSLSRCHRIWDRDAKSKTDKTSYFPIYKVCTQFFQPSDFFACFIRTSCYVKHITGNFYRLHSSSIMQAITGDLGRMQDEWGLSLGFATEVSTLAFLQHTVAESLSIPFMVERRFCTAAHIKSAGKNNKKTWLLQCLLSFLQETDRWLY